VHESARLLASLIGGGAGGRLYIGTVAPTIGIGKMDSLQLTRIAGLAAASMALLRCAGSSNASADGGKGVPADGAAGDGMPMGGDGGMAVDSAAPSFDAGGHVGLDGSGAPDAEATSDAPVVVPEAGDGASVGPNGDGGGACMGTPTPCEALTDAQCRTSPQCASGKCTGTAASCATFTDEFHCTLQLGCGAWDGTKCPGTATPCSALGSSETYCNSQSGCSYVVGCNGQPPACATLGATECLAQPGCSLR
jgi:hypothetical protein